MERLRILIATNDLAARNGGALYVRDLALGLLRSGHTPIVYAVEQGAVAEELLQATVPAISDPDQIGAAPDVIHGHAPGPLLVALLQFPDTPAVFVCHGWSGRSPEVMRFPRLHLYVAVDDTVADRLAHREGIATEQIRTVLNAVDLERFLPRGPLPERPGRALVFSNYAANDTQLPAVAEACAGVGIALDVIGGAAGKVCATPEKMLGQYDLVFAKGRCALEALAVGAAVVVCDASGVGPLVTTANYPQLRRENFGCRALQQPVRADALIEQIRRYDPAEAFLVHRQVRSEAGLDAALTAHLQICREAIELQQRGAASGSLAEHRAAARILHHRETRVRQPQRMTKLKNACEALQQEVETLRRALAGRAPKRRRWPLVGALALRLARWSR